MCWRPDTRPTGRPCVLLLHGFPELAYSWRKIMLPLAAAGYHVIAPDQRGYGRTTGWDGDYDGDLAPFRMLNVVKDALGLVSALGHRSVAAVIGHDFGSPVAAWCALARPDVFRSVVMMSAPFAGPPALPFAGAKDPPTPRPRRSSVLDDLAALARPRKHYQWYYSTREANDEHAACRAGHSRLPARLLSPQERRLERQPAVPARVERRRAGEDADLLHHGSGPGHGRDGRARNAVRRRDRGLQVADRRRAARLQRRIRPHRIPGRPELVSLPDRRHAECRSAIFSGRTIDQPSCFIAGASDWGVYQKPGDFERCRRRPARGCLGATSCRAPATGCSRSGRRR